MKPCHANSLGYCLERISIFHLFRQLPASLTFPKNVPQKHLPDQHGTDSIWEEPLGLSLRIPSLPHWYSLAVVQSLSLSAQITALDLTITVYSISTAAFPVFISIFSLLYTYKSLKPLSLSNICLQYVSPRVTFGLVWFPNTLPSITRFAPIFHGFSAKSSSTAVLHISRNSTSLCGQPWVVFMAKDFVLVCRHASCPPHPRWMSHISSSYKLTICPVFSYSFI